MEGPKIQSGQNLARRGRGLGHGATLKPTPALAMASYGALSTISPPTSPTHVSPRSPLPDQRVPGIPWARVHPALGHTKVPGEIGYAQVLGVHGAQLYCGTGCWWVSGIPKSQLYVRKIRMYSGHGSTKVPGIPESQEMRRPVTISPLAE